MESIRVLLRRILTHPNPDKIIGLLDRVRPNLRLRRRAAADRERGDVAAGSVGSVTPSVVGALETSSDHLPGREGHVTVSAAVHEGLGIPSRVAEEGQMLAVDLPSQRTGAQLG
jgi:hypothetical protein